MKIVNCKLKIAKHSGFTLIEIMVAMAIVAIISGVVLVNVGKNDDRDARLEADRVMAFIREAQNSALAGDNVFFDEVADIGKKNCGFGVSESSTSELKVYYKFVSGPSTACSSSKLFVTGDPFTDRSLTLGNGVTIDHTEDPVVPFDVFFEMPSGKTYLAGNGACVLGATPTQPKSVILEKGSVSISVKVECTGRIYID